MPKSKLIGKTAAGVDPHAGAELLDALEEAVVAIDAAGEVTYANPAAATLFGADPLRTPEVLPAVLRGNPWLAQAIRVALAESRSLARHQARLELLESHRTVGLRVTPLFNAEGELRGALLLLFDETSLEALTETERRVDKLDELATLAAGLAHEIKNPLGGILGAAQLLRSEKLGTEGRECLDVIEHDVRRINRLIEGLLDFGKPRELARAAVNLHQVIDAVLAGLAKDPLAAGHAFVRDYDPSLPEVEVNADGVHQVVLNLAKNALEAAAPGTAVVIRTRVDLAARRVSRRAVRLEVQNEGAPISDDVKARLFTPFFTTKATGSGLGLPVSLRIIREHGGSIDVVCDRGRTTFTVTLPMAGHDLKR